MTTETTKEQKLVAQKLIAEKQAQIDALQKECVEIADANDVVFSSSVLNVYGTGAYYEPQSQWEESSCSGYEYDGWNASSQSC